jgi:integrase
MRALLWLTRYVAGMSYVQETPNGKFKARWREDGKLKSRNFSLKGDAWSFLDARNGKTSATLPASLVTVTAGVAVPAVRPTSITLDQFIENGGFVTDHLRPTTASTYSQLLKVLRAKFGDVPLVSISHVDLQRWLLEDVAATRKALTVKHIAKITLAVMNAAMRAGVIGANPAVGLKTPRNSEPHEAHFISPPEMEKLAEQMAPRYRIFVYLGGWAGLRIGEICALRWGSVDMFTRKLTVRETVSEVDGRQHFGPPKTKSGRRSISLPGNAFKAMLEHRELLHTLGLPTDATDFVVRGEGGDGVRASNFRKRVWIPAATSSGLMPLVPHDLRHSAVSLWIAAGLTPKEVSVRAGHASVSFTFDQYGHLFPSKPRSTDWLGVG